MTVASIGGLIAFSYAVEALRPRPKSPQRLAWAPALPLAYATLGSVRVRYIRAGAGPPIVLFHTLRTQLDIFQKLVFPLAAHFTVYAFDYPGHGWSDIPQAAYAPEDFYRWAAAFLDELHIERATVAGLSIGGTIALVLAARRHPRVARVVAINPYDYPPDGGIRHSSLMARVILGPAGVPLLGSTLMRLRNRFVSDRIMEGAVACATSLSPELKKELYEVGARLGHHQGFLRLLSNERRWSQARDEYPRIGVPSLLVYGDQDWAPERVREIDRRCIPGVKTTCLAGGHFLSLDQPQKLAELITQFCLATQG
jgi:pimeloyl-ACP methyl ester carboxylesterase